MIKRTFLSWIYLSFLYIFLFFPALIVVLFSFNTSRVWSFPLRGITWRWYEELLARPDAVAAAMNSLIVATVTMTVSVALGGAVAFAFHQWRFSAKNGVESLLLLPLLVPNLIWAIGLLLLVGAIHLPTGPATVILGHVVLTMPYVFLLVRSRLQSLDPNLERAARGLGATSPLIFRRIILPHVGPALLASALISFATSFSELVVAFFLTGAGFNTLPVFIYSLIEIEPSPIVNAIASIIFFVAVTCMLSAALIGGREVAFTHGGDSHDK